MEILTPIEPTLRSEKGSPLTHEEMDNNLRLLKILVDNRPELKAAAVFKPEHITISGTTNITSDMVNGSEALQAYLQNPLTIKVNSFFDPSLGFWIMAVIETDGGGDEKLIGELYLDESDTLRITDLYEIHQVYKNTFGTVPLIISFKVGYTKAFSMQVGTYTKVSSSD